MVPSPLGLLGSEEVPPSEEFEPPSEGFEGLVPPSEGFEGFEGFEGVELPLPESPELVLPPFDPPESVESV